MLVDLGIDELNALGRGELAVKDTKEFGLDLDFGGDGPESEEDVPELG
jgi:hypothetical protein